VCVCVCVCVWGEPKPAVHWSKICGPKITANRKSCECWAAHSHVKLSEQRVDVSCQIKWCINILESSLTFVKAQQLLVLHIFFFPYWSENSVILDIRGSVVMLFLSPRCWCLSCSLHKIVSVCIRLVTLALYLRYLALLCWTPCSLRPSVPCTLLAFVRRAARPQCRAYSNLNLTLQPWA
jgi:hypothetical protein